MSLFDFDKNHAAAGEDLVEAEDPSRYRLSHATEVERVLRGVMQERSLVTVTCDDGATFLVTNVVGLNPAQGVFFLGWGGDVRVSAALLGSSEIAVSTMQGRVKVQFDLQGLKRDSLEGVPVFRAQIPASLLYFQRREFYRQATPLVNPVVCHIPIMIGNIEAILLDISIGGGLLSYHDGPLLQAGQVYTGCRMALPGGKSFMVNFKVMNAFSVTLQSGEVAHRASCQFVSLPPSLESEIQRFINNIERGRRV